MSVQEKQHVTVKEIWTLTWPQALMMIFQFMLSLTNVLVAGQIGTDVQAVFGVITQCLFLLLVVGMAIANGGAAAMSQSLGARLFKRADRYVGLLLKLAILLCIITVTAGYSFRLSIFTALAVPAGILELTESLWVLFLISVPGHYIISFSGAIYRSRKLVHIPLLSGVITCITNIFGSFGLGLGWFGFPQMGGTGLILSAIISTYLGAFINIIILVRTKSLSRKSFAPWRWEKKAFPYILKVALPSGGLQVVWQLGYLMLFSIVATLPSGISAIAGLTAGNRVESLLYLPTTAFSMTGSILVGHCLGAGDKREAKLVALKVMGSGIMCMSLIAFVVFQFIGEIGALVAPDPVVRGIAEIYLFYNFLAVPCTCISMVCGGIMSGAGATIYTFIIYGTATWGIRLPLAWFMGHNLGMGEDGVFSAMLISQIFQAAAILFVLLRCDWYKYASTAKRFSRGTS